MGIYPGLSFNGSSSKYVDGKQIFPTSVNFVDNWIVIISIQNSFLILITWPNRVRPTYLDSLMSVASLLVGEGRAKEGWDLMERALHEAPLNPDVHNNAGSFLLKIGEVQRRGGGRRCAPVCDIYKAIFFHETSLYFLQVICKKLSLSTRKQSGFHLITWQPLPV